MPSDLSARGNASATLRMDGALLHAKYRRPLPLGPENLLPAAVPFVTGIPPGRLGLPGPGPLWRLADAGPGRPIAQLEPLAIIAELAVEGRRNRLQFQQVPLPLDHDGGTR